MHNTHSSVFLNVVSMQRIVFLHEGVDSMDILFVGAQKQDLPTRDAIVQSLGTRATLMTVSMVSALSGGLGRHDLVILPLQEISDDVKIGIELLRQQKDCPVLCIFSGNVPEEFKKAIAPSVIVDAVQPDWKQVILDQMPRRPALSAV